MSILFNIINVIGVILEVLIALVFFETVADKKERPENISIIIGIIGIIIQSFVIIYFEEQIIVSIVFYILIIIASFCYRLTMLKRVAFSVLLIVMYFLSEIMVGLILTIISDVSVQQLRNNIIYYIQGVLVSKLIMFVIIKTIGYFSVKSEVIVSRYVFIPTITLLVTTFMVIYAMSEIIYGYKPGMILNISIVTIILLIISNILVFYLFEHQLKMSNMEKQEQMIKQQLEYKLEYYKELSKKQQITNKTMHDLKNQLFALKEVLKNNPREGTERINSICDNIMSESLLKFTGIEAVDALITSKLEMMKKKNIKFFNTTYILKDNKIDSMDICVLLGNLLDNAIEANDKIVTDERYINLKITQQFEYTSIIISNAINETVNIQSNRIITTKKNKELHGFGLKSVNEIVKKYSGNLDFRQYDKEFEVILMLKNSNFM